MALEVLDLEKVLPGIVESIVREFRPLKIILFGSYARGTQYRHSDLDLMVVMPEGVDRHNTAVSIMKLLDFLPVGVDVVVTTLDRYREKSEIYGTLHHEVSVDGRELYAAD